MTESSSLLNTLNQVTESLNQPEITLYRSVEFN